MPKNSRVYLINLGRRNTQIVLQDASPAKFMGMPCIKGTHHYRENFWTEGKTVYVPLENISDVVEFDSLAEYKQRVKKHFDQQSK
jgi:hypothetical protein